MTALTGRKTRMGEKRVAILMMMRKKKKSSSPCLNTGENLKNAHG